MKAIKKTNKTAQIMPSFNYDFSKDQFLLSLNVSEERFTKKLFLKNVILMSCFVLLMLAAFVISFYFFIKFFMIISWKEDLILFVITGSTFTLLIISIWLLCKMIKVRRKKVCCERKKLRNKESDVIRFNRETLEEEVMLWVRSINYVDSKYDLAQYVIRTFRAKYSSLNIYNKNEVNSLKKTQNEIWEVKELLGKNNVKVTNFNLTENLQNDLKFMDNL